MTCEIIIVSNPRRVWVIRFGIRISPLFPSGIDRSAPCNVRCLGLGAGKQGTHLPKTFFSMKPIPAVTRNIGNKAKTISDTAVTRRLMSRCPKLGFIMNTRVAIAAPTDTTPAGVKAQRKTLRQLPISLTSFPGRYYVPQPKVEFGFFQGICRHYSRVSKFVKQL